jgi:hypothetical protein
MYDTIYQAEQLLAKAIRTNPAKVHNGGYLLQVRVLNPNLNPNLNPKSRSPSPAPSPFPSPPSSPSPSLCMCASPSPSLCTCACYEFKGERPSLTSACAKP